MCEPISAATAALAVTSSVAQMVGNKKALEHQARVQAENTRRNNKAAMDSYLINTQQMNLGKTQENEALADEKLALKLETRKRAATARAGSAETGLAGYSIDAQVQDIIKQGLDNVTTLDTNQEYSDANFAIQQKGIYQQAKANQAGFQPYQPSPKLFYTGAALKIAGSGVQGYAAGKSATG